MRTPRTRAQVFRLLSLVLTLPSLAVHAQAPAGAMQSQTVGRAATTPAAAAPPVIAPSSVSPAVKASSTGAVAVSPTTAPVTAPSSVSPGAKATVTPGVSASTQATTPVQASGITAHDLFKLDDNAIIIIGGKQQHAGDLKKEIKADLTGTPRGTQRLYHVASHTPHPTPAPIAPANTPVQQGPTRHINLAEMQVPTIAAPNMSPAKMERPKSCAELEPLIDRARSPAVSGSQFTLDGFCFGDRPGSVELIGQFPGGVLRPSFQQWKDDQLVVVVPSLRGVPDQTTALTVVRADGKRSTARKLKFIAQRERIEVPMHYWTPTGDFDQTVVTEDGGNIFSGFHATGIASQVAGNFNIHVGEQCALDNLDVPATAGGVVSVTGFENGPPNEAAIVLTYAPTCTTHTFDYVIGSDSTTVCRIAFQLHTWASCPTGTAP